MSLSQQHPLPSGFGFHSTADDVLAGLDLSGRLALVTGGYSGIGIETTRALAKAGAQVVVPARRPLVAQEQVAGIDGVEVGELDLGDLDSVARFAAGFLASGRSIDLVVDSAAVMANPLTRVGPGWESQFATNHLGHFALVGRLWPALVAGGGARVVSVSSIGHQRSPIRWHDIDFAQDGSYDKWEAYGQAKTANALFAVQLDALGKGAGVRAFAVHPGGILTPLQRHLSHEEQVEMGWIDENGKVLSDQFKSPQEGAATQTWAATSPRLDGLGGLYLEDCDVASPYVEGGPRVGVKPYAVDADEAARLWTLSVERTGVDPLST